MEIFSIHRESLGGLNTFDGAVVIAENEFQARLIHPDRISFFEDGKWRISRPTGPDRDNDDGSWVLPGDVLVIHIGSALPEFTNNKVVCASFNAAG
jgi:hypothetical protein